MRGRKTAQLLALASAFAMLAIYAGFFVPKELQSWGGAWGKEMEVLASVGEDSATQIVLKQNGSQVLGSGASVSNNRILIVQGGEYRIAGVLEEGQIYVEARDKEAVTLILAGVEISNQKEAAIYIKNAYQARIVLEAGSENILQSGSLDAGGAEEAGADAEDAEEAGADAEDAEEADANAEDAEGADADASKAALYSRDDLTILGEGSLMVQGYENNGIHTTDHLLVEGGTLLVEAKNHGIKGKDSLTVAAGNILVEAQQDALHSDERVEISGGGVTLLAGDDGIHADKELVVLNGSIEILRSYEGMEANQVQIEGGNIRIKALDDGINANGGESQGMPGGDGFERQRPEEILMDQPGGMAGTPDEWAEPSEAFAGELPELRIVGGDLYINAEGDGLDSNGNLFMEGGTVVIDGPSDNGNGAIDSGTELGGVCEIRGGTVLAVGSSGMAESFGEGSSQYSFQYSFEASFDAGDEIVITDGEGRELYRHTAVKEGSSVVFSCPEMEQGEECYLQAGGQSARITLDSVSTSLGRTGGAFGPLGGGMDHGPGGGLPGGEGPEGGTPDGEGPERGMPGQEWPGRRGEPQRPEQEGTE